MVEPFIVSKQTILWIPLETDECWLNRNEAGCDVCVKGSYLLS